MKKTALILLLPLWPGLPAFAVDHELIQKFADENGGKLPGIVPKEDTLVKLKPGCYFGRPLVDLAKLKPEGRQRMLKTGVQRWVVINHLLLSQKLLTACAEVAEPHRIIPLDLTVTAVYQNSPLVQADAIRALPLELEGGDPSLALVVVGTGINSMDPNLNTDCARSQSFTPQSPDPCVGDGNHETLVAKNAVGKGLDGWLPGISPGAPVISYKIFSALDGNGKPMPPLQFYTTTEEMANAMAALGDIDARLVIANCSFSAGQSQAFRDIMEGQQDKVLYVAAAGNFGWNLNQVPDSPCFGDLPNVLCVAWEDYPYGNSRRGPLSSYSDFGDKVVNIAAPGFIPGQGAGSSFAAPWVAGTAYAAARLLASDKRSPAYTKQLITGSAEIDPWLLDPAGNLVQEGATLNTFQTVKNAISGLPTQKAKPLAVTACVGSWSFQTATAAGDLLTCWGEGLDGDLQTQINGLDALVFYRDEYQINLWMPMDPFQFRPTMNVLTFCRLNADGVYEAGAKIEVPARPTLPAVGGIIHADGLPIDQAYPAITGETVTLLMSGLGATSPMLDSRKPVTEKEVVHNQVTVMLGDTVVPTQATVSGFGVYKIAVKIGQCGDSHVLNVAVTAGGDATGVAIFPCSSHY